MTDENKNESISLLSEESTGGLHSLDGYKYQDVFVISKLPELIQESAFYSLIKEGLGDIEIKFKNGNEFEKTYCQAKDFTSIHIVTYLHIMKIFNTILKIV